jgi:putative endonuclease
MPRWPKRARDTDGASGEARRRLGRRGERLAARHLRRKGYRIVRRNLRIRKDEADLVAIAPDGRTVVIVEVKTQTGTHHDPELKVNRAKQYHLARLAANLLRMKRFEGRPIRFDVVAIHWPADADPRVRHYVAAFQSPV